MKKLVSLFLVCCLMATILPMAFADGAGVYSSTRKFLEALTEHDLSYYYKGINDNDQERVEVSIGGDNFDYTINCFFYEDNDTFGMRIWNIIEYHKADFTHVLSACNDLNNEWRYVKFYCDESDNTVTAAIDGVLLNDANDGELAYQYLVKLGIITDDGYPTLSPYHVG